MATPVNVISLLIPALIAPNVATAPPKHKSDFHEGSSFKRKAQGHDTCNRDEAAHERASRRLLVFESLGERNDREWSQGNDGQNNSGGRFGKRELKAAHSEDRTSHAIDQK